MVDPVEPTLIASRRHRRVYDHQGNLRTIPKVIIPSSTIKSWRRRGAPPVVTLAPVARQQQDLAATIAKLENRVRVLAAVVRILLALIRAAGFSLAAQRLPEGAAKARILRAVASAQAALPLNTILKIMGISPSRYHAWRRRSVPTCGLDDRSSCPPQVQLN